MTTDKLDFIRADMDTLAESNLLITCALWIRPPTGG